MRNTIDVLGVNTWIDTYGPFSYSQETVTDKITEWKTEDWRDRGVDIPENCEVVWYESYDVLAGRRDFWELNGTLWVAEIVPDPENDARYLVCRVCREGFLEADDWKQHAQYEEEASDASL